MIPDVLTDDRTQVAAAEADRVMEPCTLVLFGASGDLVQRMMVPAIFLLARRGLLSLEFRLIDDARSTVANQKEFKKFDEPFNKLMDTLAETSTIGLTREQSSNRMRS